MTLLVVTWCSVPDCTIPTDGDLCEVHSGVAPLL
jgi:hypothetical protein